MQSHTLASRWVRAAVLAQIALTFVPFIDVARCLAAHPDAEQNAMVAFFVPPILASFFVLADNGRFERTAVRGAWVLLTVNLVVAFAAAIDALPITAQFPGVLPPRIDRVLIYYLIGWNSFVLIVCPVWHLHWRFAGNGRDRGCVGLWFIVCWSAWALVVGTFITLAFRKLF